MNFVSQLVRLVPLAAGAFLAATSLAAAQADPEKPVTPPDSYRVVMENDRMRMIEVHIKPHSKVHVDSPANRDASSSRTLPRSVHFLKSSTHSFPETQQC